MGLSDFSLRLSVGKVSVRHYARLKSTSTFFRGVVTGAAESIYGLRLAVQSAEYEEKTDTLRLTLEKIKKPAS
jgi:hypothetical protein